MFSKLFCCQNDYQYKLILSLFILIFLSSCHTNYSLWNKSYEEKVWKFVTTQDTRKIAFIGEKYHYVFPDNGELMKHLLFWKHYNILYFDVNKSYLKIDQNNNVSGYVTILTLFMNPDRKDKIYLKSLGFRRNDSNHLSLKMVLHGKRYLANNKKYKTIQLNKMYNFTIHYDENINFFNKITKATLSPITMTLGTMRWREK